MIVDTTGTVLIPGNEGRNCLGNGTHDDEQGNRIECCCDECDYYLECFPDALLTYGFDDEKIL
ncbi:hypothetical protein H6A12_03120 [Phocea massiliensis]|uniref:Uncharacterized protein n=1 Tax=Merdimmobilis hominis TaxID=2897707 RepID=A0A938X5H1_9FIRM|nr:hypothetical protein [Merdimmobilis hominis]MBM6920150.1 hypothetical protein [Merdimmobilis hominis]